MIFAIVKIKVNRAKIKGAHPEFFFAFDTRRKAWT